MLCLGFCFDMCFGEGCVSRVHVHGVLRVLWVVFCVGFKWILFLSCIGVGFLVLGFSDFVVFLGLNWVMG